MQIEDEFQGLAYHTNLSSVAVYGGVEAGPQERGLRGSADIVVATPGRLLDHMGTQRAEVRRAGRARARRSRSDARHGILAERAPHRGVAAGEPADAPLFGDNVGRSGAVGEPDHAGAEDDSRRARRRAGDARSSTSAVWCPRQRRPTGWAAFSSGRTAQAWCSCARNAGRDKLARRLAAGGIKCAALHADRTQSERSAAVEGFKSGRFRALIATDIAARGIDIDGIGHVVNYEVPLERRHLRPSRRAHRARRIDRHRADAGRAGRAGGVARHREVTQRDVRSRVSGASVAGGSNA